MTHTDITTDDAAQALKDAFAKVNQLPKDERSKAIGQALGIQGIVETEPLMKEAKTGLLHTVVFGSPDEKPTLTKARGWLKRQYDAELTNGQIKITAWALQWLRSAHRIKTVFNKQGILTECTVSHNYQNNRQRQQFRLRKAGASDVLLAKRYSIPTETELHR